MALTVASETALAWEAWLKSQVGKPYDQDAIIGFILGRKDHGSGHWICSALQTGALEAVGCMPRLIVPPAQVTPDCLRTVFSALGARMIGSA